MVGTDTIDTYIKELRCTKELALPPQYIFALKASEQEIASRLGRSHSLFTSNCTGYVHALGGGRVEPHTNTITEFNFIRDPYSTWLLTPTDASARHALSPQGAFRFAALDLLHDLKLVAGGIVIVDSNLYWWNKRERAPKKARVAPLPLTSIYTPV